MKKHIQVCFFVIAALFGSINLYAAAPTVSASGITFSNVSSTAAKVSWTNGNGALRILVASQGAPVSWVPTDMTQLTGASTNFTGAANQGGGNKVLYSSSNNNVNINGLTAGQTYYFTVYEFNGSNSSSPYTATYRTISAPVNNLTTFSPSINVTPTSLSGFVGPIGGYSPEQTYTVSGTQVYSDVVVTPGTTQYKVSTVSGGPYTSSVSITPVANTVNATIYVVLAPSVSIGTKSGTITNSSNGATSKYVSVTGNAVANYPTVATSGVTIPTLLNTSMNLSWTNGNGAYRMVVVKSGSAVDWQPTDFTQVSGVNANFTSASDQGSGNKVVASGNVSSVNITGLIAGQTYYYAIYEYNGSNVSSPATAAYYFTGAPTGSATTFTPSLSATPSSLSAFTAPAGNVSAEQTYLVSGTELVSDVTITPPSGYKLSTVSGGPYNASLTLTPVSNQVSTTIYVVFSPTAGSSGTTFSGNITNSTTGVTTQNVAVTGLATNPAPSTAASNITFTSLTNNSVRVNWTNGNGTARVVVMRQGSPVSWTPTNQTLLTGVSSDFSAAADQGSGNKVVYNSTNNYVIVGGLVSGLTYYVTVYEYKGSNTTVPYLATYLITGAPTASVTALVPSITAAPSSLSGFASFVGATSPQQTFIVSGTQVFGNLVITPGSSQYLVSTVSGGPYSSSATITPVNNTIPNTTIYVVLAPTTSGTKNAVIQCTSTAATTQQVSVSGLAYTPAYVWTGATNLDWQVATNWTPTRTFVSAGDTLRFNTNPAGIIYNVPAVTAKRIDIIGSGTSVSLQAASVGTAITPNLSSGSGYALYIATGCSLNLVGTNAQTISLGSGCSAYIGGTMTLSNANHALSATGTWTFASGSTVYYTGGAAQTVSALNYYNLNLSGSNTISLAAGTISLGGSFVNNTTTAVQHNNGTVSFTGTSVTIGGSATTDFNNLTISTSASVALANNATLKGTLALGNQSTFTTTGYSFTLLSGPSSTARIDIIPTSATFTGSITMQRYVPESGGRYWYHFGAPVSGATFLQLKTSNTTSLPTNPDNGIFITGTGITNVTPNIPSIGIDNTFTASIYSFSTTSNAWVKPTNLASTFPTKVGYRFFIRDGSVEVAPTTGAKYLALTGTPNKGTQNYALTYGASSAGWNLIANPYPSDITADLSNGGWNTSSANLANNTVYIWNSDASAYVSCLNGSPSTAGACTIPSFQGFWVATTAAGTLVSTENVKVSGSSTIYRIASSYALPVTLTNIESNVAHGTLIRFDKAASAGFDADVDALHKFSDGLEGATNSLSVYSSLKGKDYSINTVPSDFKDVIILNISASAGQNTLSFGGLNLPAETQVYLQDIYTGDLTEVLDNTQYTFEVTNDPASQNSRFALIFNDPAGRTSSDVSTVAAMTLFPNPAHNGDVNIILSNCNMNGDAVLVVYDAVGNVISRQMVQDKFVKIATDNMKPGIYNIVCTTPEGQVSNKLVVE